MFLKHSAKFYLNNIDNTGEENGGDWESDIDVVL
jgi:hypothetical protein